MTDDTTPGDLTGNVREVREVQNELRNRFKATESRVTAHGEEVEVRLEFRGFQTLADALDRVSEVSLGLDHITATSDVRAGVHGEGFDYPAETDAPDDPPDDRPAGWVSASYVIGIKADPDSEGDQS